MKDFLGASIRSFAGRIIGAASALIASFSITSTLTIAESGLFFLSLGFAVFFSHALKLGLDTFLLKKCSILLSDNKYKDFFSLTLASAMICIIGSSLVYVASIVFEWANIYEYARYLNLALPAAISMALMGIIAHSLHALGYVFIGTVTNIAINYLFFSLCIYWFKPTDAVEAVYYFSVSGALALAIQIGLATLLFKRSGIQTSLLDISYPSRSSLLEIYQTTIPLWVIVISQQLNQWGAQFISSVHVPESDLALLSIAMRIALIVPMILLSVNLVVSPQFAALYHRGEIAKIETVLKKSLRLLAVVSLLVIIALVLFGDEMLQIFGEQYVEGKLLLAILVCGQLVNALTGPCGRLLMMSGYEKEFRNSSIVITLLGLCVSYVLVRWYGVYGAAAATAIVIAAQNIFLAYLVNSKIKISLLKVYRNILR